MNRDDQDRPPFLPNAVEGLGGLYVTDPDANSFHPHQYAGNAFGQGSLIEPGPHQYPLTPLEGPHPAVPQSHTTPQPPTGLSPHDLPPTGFHRPSETGPHVLAQDAWGGFLPQQATSSVDGQFSDANLGLMLANQPQLSMDFGYLSPVGTGPPLTAGSVTGDVFASCWDPYVPGATLPPVPTDQPGIGIEGSPKPEKVKRKRGRPRLYEDDGTERPRRKPGRPPTYVIGGESGASSTPRLQGFQSMSSTSTSESGSAISPGWPASVTSEPSTSSNVSSGDKGKAKELPASIDKDDDEDDEEEDEEEARKQAVVRARNKTAASRYRAKTQMAIAMMEAEEQNVSTRRQELMSCVTQLREEVFYLKNEVLRQASCGCPLISGYLTEAARLAYSSTTPPLQQPRRMGSISSGMEGMVLSGGDQGQLHQVAHLEGCLQKGAGASSGGGGDGDGDGENPVFA